MSREEEKLLRICGMIKEELIEMIRLVEQDLIQDAKKKRGRDYFDGVRNAVNLIVANINHEEET